MLENKAALPAGTRKTRQRTCVLELLEQSDAPMSATDIFIKAQGGDSSVCLSTVYRILDHFAGEGFVLKTSGMEGGMALYELNRNQHKHYAVCVNCHKVVELVNCPMEKFVPEIAENDFRVVGHRVEMYGYCKDCDRKIGGIH